MQRLADIMPKKTDKPWDGKSMMHIEMHPIRQSSEAFSLWLDNELPANKEEMIATLWVFGEILNGEMERMLNESNLLRGDLLRTTPFPINSIELSDELAATFSTDSGVRVEAGRYEWKSGKSFKDCRMEDKDGTKSTS